MRRNLQRASGAAILLVTAGWAASCGSSPGHATTNGSGGHASTSSSGTGGTGGTGGAGTVPPFAPAGCSFQIAARPEYGGFRASASVVGSTPNIRRVRLGLGGNVVPGAKGHADPSTSIAMAWQTDEGTLASEVQWGVGTDPTKWPAANRASGVTWDTPPGTINADGAERMHEVYVCGLTPATTYSYRVGGGPAGAEVWSDVHTFTTTPSAGASSVKIAVQGDSRGEDQNAWQVLQQRLLSDGVALELFSGDAIIAASDQGEWEEWLDKAWKDGNGKLSALGQILTLAAHGNHENHTSLFYGNLVLPQDVATYPSYAELFYAVDVGPLHVVVVDDSFIVDTTGDPAYQGVLTKWLDEDLTAANANRAQVPWIVTLHHHSAYSSSTHGKDGDVLAGRAFFAPLWQKYHVDVDFGGHDHDYERTNPLSVGADPDSPTATTPDKGTVYVVCGGSGADPYPAGTSSFTAVSKDITGGGGIGFYNIVSADAHTLTLESHELESDGSDPLVETPAFSITK